MNRHLATSGVEEQPRSLYVLQLVGVALSPLIDAILPTIGPPASIEVATPDAAGPCYVATAEGLPATLAGLHDGRFGAVVLRAAGRSVRHGLLVAPSVYGGRLSCWMAIVEFAAPEWRSTWNDVLRRGGFHLAVLSIDEMIDLSDDQLTTDAFPWGERRLVVASIPTSDGRWVTRENPDPRW